MQLWPAPPPPALPADVLHSKRITAEDVRLALKIPLHEAEDLVFVADTANDGSRTQPSIDFFEFHEVVTNFS